jgi:uncharacterized protein (TIGR03435 family)
MKLAAADAALEVHDDPTADDAARADMRDAMLAAFNNGLAPLGLRLERRTATVETLVVDHVERTPADRQSRARLSGNVIRGASKRDH